MSSITFTQARKHLAETIDRVVDGDLVIVQCRYHY